jgi:hypothetical protein
MSYLMIRHSVEDFGTWKLAYDAHFPARQAAGLKEAHLMHNVDDSNEVVALFEAHDMKKAQEFLASPDLRNGMQQAGVVGNPHIIFLEAV